MLVHWLTLVFCCDVLQMLSCARVADVTELQLPANAFDLVFSNWLLMYLSDEEVAKLAATLLSWVRGAFLWSPFQWLLAVPVLTRRWPSWRPHC